MIKIPLRLALKYYWDAQTIYSAHSPFIYNFFTQILNAGLKKDGFRQIEEKRSALKSSRDSMTFIDFGAGTSSGDNRATRKISDVAKNSLSGYWQCRIMFNMIEEYNLGNILEVGTSLGISTAYFSMSEKSTQIITLEGNPGSAEIAKGLWKDLGQIDSIDLRIGEFDATLQKAAEDLGQIDFAFIDGNHRKDATISYFTKLKKYRNSKSVYVIDDIYWSQGMNEAWNQIIQDDDVAFSIDLFRMGIVFFDQSIMPKQHYKLIPYIFKPWALGLFG